MKNILIAFLGVFVLSLPALSLAHGLEGDGLDHHGDLESFQMMGSQDSMYQMMQDHHPFLSGPSAGFWIVLVMMNLLVWLLGGLLFVAWLIKQLNKK